jgi:autotransporter-associated beta strand protein
VISGGGSVIKTGSGIQALGGNNIYTGATTVNGGILAVNGSITSPVMVNSSGSLQGAGNINSSVVISSNATLTPGNFYNATSTPGILTINGTTTLSNGSVLNINLGGINTTQFSQLHVNGQLNLGASSTLSVSLVNGFEPLVGAAFDIVNWTTLSGLFTAPSSSFNGRILWNSSLLNTTGVISVANTFYAGDFNRDSHVDAADLIGMMQALSDPSHYEAADNLTSAQLNLIGDVNGDGYFNNADIQAFINLLQSGGGSADSVPEPASIVLFSLGALALVFRRRSRLIAVTKPTGIVSEISCKQCKTV